MSDKTPPGRPEGDSGSPPPTSQCPICVGVYKDRCHSCMHEFCFCCLMRWSKTKGECPLCKKPFGAIRHNIKSENDCEEYIFPNTARVDPPPRPIGQLQEFLQQCIPVLQDWHVQLSTMTTVDPVTMSAMIRTVGSAVTAADNVQRTSVDNETDISSSTSSCNCTKFASIMNSIKSKKRINDMLNSDDNNMPLVELGSENVQNKASHTVTSEMARSTGHNSENNYNYCNITEDNRTTPRAYVDVGTSAINDMDSEACSGPDSNSIKSSPVEQPQDLSDGLMGLSDSDSTH